MSGRHAWGGRWWMLALAAPSLLLMALFFFVPAIEAMRWSFYMEQPFGLERRFVGLQNYVQVLTDPLFLRAAALSLLFVLTGAGGTVVVALVLALLADSRTRGAALGLQLLIWPGAVAGSVAGVVFLFLLGSGGASGTAGWWPGGWNPWLDAVDANVMVNTAYVWIQFPFTLLIFYAGLQAIPQAYLDAATMDGAGAVRRALDVQLPLLTPQIFLAMVIETGDSLRSAFSIIDTMTQGGPAGSTQHLAYKIFTDGFRHLDFSGSATMSVLLMGVMVVLTLLQFRSLERRVHYER
jgi:sn-glycerol 3-phosphate transport system permease protein